MRAPLLSTRTDRQAAGFDRLPFSDLRKVQASASPPFNWMPGSVGSPGEAVGVYPVRGDRHAVARALLLSTRLRRRNSRRFSGECVIGCYGDGVFVRSLALSPGTDTRILPSATAGTVSSARRS